MTVRNALELYSIPRCRTDSRDILAVYDIEYFLKEKGEVSDMPRFCPEFSESTALL